MIPYGRQHIDEDDIAAVTEVLTSIWLTQGPAIPAFEQAVAKKCNAHFAIAVSNATAALHIACLALEVGPGDTVWTSPISFVASANCALYCGASIDFVDIDISTGNMCVVALREKLIAARQQKTLPKVVIPVHFAGQSCDMAQIAKLAEEFHFSIIEDASHAIGARYQDQPVGSCQYADICIFSFHPVKIITSGEGGMALTNQPILARRLQMLRSHGITSEAAELTEPSHGPWYYQQQLLGFNYRLTDIQAALGLSQLNKLDRFVDARNQLAKRYDQLFANSKKIAPLITLSNCKSSYHLYVVRLLQSDVETRKGCIEYLRREGVAAHLHYIPIYLQPYYQNMGFKAGYCQHAEQYYSEAITLPLFPGLYEWQQDVVVNKLEAYLLT